MKKYNSLKVAIAAAEQVVVEEEPVAVVVVVVKGACSVIAFHNTRPGNTAQSFDPLSRKRPVSHTVAVNA